MKECKCKYVFEIEPSYIPDYSREITTANMEQPLVAVQQFECIYCGRKWGYVPMNSKLIDKPD